MSARRSKQPKSLTALAYGQSGDRAPSTVAERPLVPYGVNRLLLDTHAWLWWQVNSQRLGSTARRAISNASDIWFSVASGWELMIKRALGKLTLPFGESISEQLETDGFRSLPVTLDHVETLHSLPDLHRDPFDRMLIAQARFEGLTIVTADDQIARYSVHVIDATN